jgi:hypothetical protein
MQSSYLHFKAPFVLKEKWQAKKRKKEVMENISSQGQEEQFSSSE